MTITKGDIYSYTYKKAKIKESLERDGKFITIYEDGYVDVSTVNDEPSKTRVELQDQCDINLIIKKYQETGEITHIDNRKKGVYADLSQVKDFQGMLDTVMFAEEAFMGMPSSTRERFGNDPASLINFLSDPRNMEEAQRLGLVEIQSTQPLEPQKNEQTKQTKKQAPKATELKTTTSES